VQREPERKLPDNSDTAQAFRSPSDATRSLECLGTTDTAPEPQGKSGVEVTVWCEAIRPGATFYARWHDGERFIGGSGATAWEAVAASLREKQERARDVALPPITVATGAGRDVAAHDMRATTPRPETDVERGARARAEWWADLEYVWRSRVSPVVDALDARARRRRRQAREAPEDTPRLRVLALRSGEWADHRARALALPRADVLATCGQRWMCIGCGCGDRSLRVGCDQPTLCPACRRKHANKWRRRIVAGMDRALRIERAAWHRTPAYRRRGMRPGIYLITLTAPHSGDLTADRDAMGVGVRKLLKHATKYGWWQTYALTWEATAGRDGLGHLHCHLAVISSWVPYRRREVATDEVDHERWDSESPNARPRPPRVGRRQYTSERGLHDVWRDAMPGALVVDVKHPRTNADDALTSGVYLAKYVTKGVEPAEFTGRKAGELLCAFRSRRKVSTSAGFWPEPERECPCCEERYRLTGTPCSLQDIHPAAVLRSQAERAGWFIPRGAIQSGLRWEGG
jgi:hypothetical protein